MSTIYAAVKADHLQARKDRRSEDVASLSALIGELDKVATVDKTVSDDVSTAVIKKTIKSLEEMIGYNNERAVEEKVLFEKYLPQQLTQLEIVELVKEARTKHGFTSLPQIMSFMKNNYAGTYDAKFAAEEAKRQIS